jgi:hypothetical protein
MTIPKATIFFQFDVSSLFKKTLEQKKSPNTSGSYSENLHYISLKIVDLNDAFLAQVFSCFDDKILVFGRKIRRQ